MNEYIKYIVVDLFAGAGGVTTGIENAKVDGMKIAKVIAAVNHDAKAIESHAYNHPDAVHFIEDIRLLKLDKLLEVVNKARVQYPNAKLIVWASAECTNYSKAKGGQPRDADSRTLPEELYRYIDALQPDILQIENVVEFMSWGPLDENGRPVSRFAGRDYLKWVEIIKDKGYDYDYRILNAANFGAYTSRERFFGMFVKPDVSIAWPAATHSKNTIGTLFEQYEKWKPVKEVLDLSVEGNSIFDRETNMNLRPQDRKPLVEATLKRIYAGLQKFAVSPFTMQYNSGSDKSRSKSVNENIGTLTTQNSHAIVQPFITQYYGNAKECSINEPASTLTTKDRLAIVKPIYFMSKAYNTSAANNNIDKPIGTLTTIDHHQFIQVDRQYFVDNQYGNGSATSIDNPVGTLTKNPKAKIVEVKRFLMDTNYSNGCKSINEPAPVITANRKYHYLINPQFNNTGWSIERPCFTLIARMDKRPPSLVTTVDGNCKVSIKSSDSETTRLIKIFMKKNGIVDVKMRMLLIDEMKLIMGFPKDYYLAGSQADQKKFIGNAVHTIVPQRWYEAMAFNEIKLIKETA